MNREDGFQSPSGARLVAAAQSTPGMQVAAGDPRPLIRILTGMQAMLAKTEWTKRALCGQTDPEVFFPEPGGSIRAAKRVCQSCEVRAECLDYALENDERFGIWGGLSEPERRRIKRQAAA